MYISSFLSLWYNLCGPNTVTPIRTHAYSVCTHTRTHTHTHTHTHTCTHTHTHTHTHDLYWLSKVSLQETVNSAGRFSHKGLCQLFTYDKGKAVYKALAAEASCATDCFLLHYHSNVNTKSIARSNEPLRHHTHACRLQRWHIGWSTPFVEWTVLFMDSCWCWGFVQKLQLFFCQQRLCQRTNCSQFSVTYQRNC